METTIVLYFLDCYNNARCGSGFPMSRRQIRLAEETFGHLVQKSVIAVVTSLEDHTVEP